MERDLGPVPPRRDRAHAGFERLPAVIVRAGEQASKRFLEFFAGSIRNPNARRCVHTSSAVVRFFAWCDHRGHRALCDRAVASCCVDRDARQRSEPAVGQARTRRGAHALRLARGRRHVRTNPAAAVRGPKHGVRKGKNPIFPLPKPARSSTRSTPRT
jgi:hypothetical protein